MHDRLLDILTAKAEKFAPESNIWLVFTPESESWDVRDVADYDRRYTKVRLVDRTRIRESISDSLYEIQPPV
jgi:hypothetical protein